MILLDGSSLTLEVFAEVTANGAGSARVGISQAARQRVSAARDVIERAIAAGAPIYGVNTGFGNLANV